MEEIVERRVRGAICLLVCPKHILGHAQLLLARRAKVGDLGQCHSVPLALEQMSESGVTMNCVLLTTMIKGFVRTKNLSKAMALFETMRGENSVVT